MSEAEPRAMETGFLSSMADSLRDRGFFEIADRIERRRCGDCRSCCFQMAVKSDGLEKPAWKRCQYESRNGCSIYENRPTACAAWFCAWRMGYGSDRDRPDRCGFMLALGASPAAGTVGVYLYASGPFNDSRAMRAIDEIAAVSHPVNKIAVTVAGNGQGIRNDGEIGLLAWGMTRLAVSRLVSDIAKLGFSTINAGSV